MPDRKLLPFEEGNHVFNYGLIRIRCRSAEFRMERNLSLFPEEIEAVQKRREILTDDNLRPMYQLLAQG